MTGGDSSNYGEIWRLEADPSRIQEYRLRQHNPEDWVVGGLPRPAKNGTPSKPAEAKTAAPAKPKTTSPKPADPKPRANGWKPLASVAKPAATPPPQAPAPADPPAPVKRRFRPSAAPPAAPRPTAAAPAPPKRRFRPTAAPPSNGASNGDANGDGTAARRFLSRVSEVEQLVSRTESQVARALVRTSDLARRGGDAGTLR